MRVWQWSTVYMSTLTSTHPWTLCLRTKRVFVFVQPAVHRFLPQKHHIQVRVQIGNHASISVSFLNRCFNVTLTLHVCKCMISQRFFTSGVLAGGLVLYKRLCGLVSEDRFLFPEGLIFYPPILHFTSHTTLSCWTSSIRPYSLYFLICL